MSPTQLAQLWACGLFTGKGRFQTLSSMYKSRKFELFQKIRNEASTLGVLYPYVSSLTMHKLLYNISWRGLAEVAYSEIGAMREPVHGISEEQRLPRLFLVSYLTNLNRLSREFEGRILNI